MVMGKVSFHLAFSVFTGAYTYHGGPLVSSWGTKHKLFSQGLSFLICKMGLIVRVFWGELLYVCVCVYFFFFLLSCIFTPVHQLSCLVAREILVP